MTTPPPPAPDRDPAPIDPHIEAMLDRALAPERAPTDLAQRVVAATASHLPRADGRGEGHHRGVLARLGQPMRLAAAFVLMAAVGIALWQFDPGNAPVPVQPVSAAASPVDALAFSDTANLPLGTDRLTALVIVTQTSDLLGRPPASVDEAAAWSRSDPLAF